MRAQCLRSSHLALALLLAAAMAACGSDKSDNLSGANTTTDVPAPAESLDVQVASFDLAVGPPRRLIVGVLTGDRRLLAFGTVKMRFAYLGTREAKVEPEPGPSQTATYLPVPGTSVPEPPPTAPQMVTGSQSRGVYSTQVGFDRAGFWQVEVTADVEGRARSAVAAFEVSDKPSVPMPGDDARPTENLTMASTDAPRAAIDSRAGRDGAEVPDPTLHSTTIAAALAAGRPVVAVFATPVYCTSRFCGPVTDMVADLEKDYGDRASFVHVEVWRDFQEKVINKAAAEWIVTPGKGANEPWLFVIGADGKITARFDNVASRAELEPLLQALPVIGRAA